MSKEKPPIVTPFSKDYVSQLTPFRKVPMRRPKLDTIPRDTINSMTPAEEKSKRIRLLRTPI